jgi:hypothetical protein
MKALNFLKNWVLFPGALAILFFSTGCSGCKPGAGGGAARAYNLKLVPGESLKDSSVVVDIIGLQSSELQLLQTYSLKKYFKSGDPVRTDLSKTNVTFRPDKQTAFELKKDDPLWTKWLAEGVQYVVVIADLPGVYEEGKNGSQDPRRQLIPLCRCYWPGGTKDLTVEVRAGGVRIVTVPRDGQTLPAW